MKGKGIQKSKFKSAIQNSKVKKRVNWKAKESFKTLMILKILTFDLKF